MAERSGRGSCAIGARQPFQLFTQVFVMTNGGPDGATSTVTFHMVQKGFREQDIAYASTIAVMFFLIIVAISMIQRFALRTREA